MSRIPLPLVAFPEDRQGASSPSLVSSSGVGTRQKTTKKDEAIRRKIEAELARKRTISTTHPASRNKRQTKLNAPKGTVAALRPSPALTVPESITVADASQLCAAKRTDCVLVVDDDESLCGIFTAKDLAYRVTAEGLDARSTPVSAIMTRNPMVTRDTTSATEALQLMVQKHFRHLPVCNEEGNVVGLLDITKVFHEALAKVERSSSASQKLYAALEGVQNEFGAGIGANPQAAAMMAYVDALRDKTALPDLSTVIDSRTRPAMVLPKSTVREAAKLMKENRTTAVCVMEGGINENGRIAGIFTSKDVVLRVIAAGLDPGRCSVVRVMTPHPDTAPPTMTVQDALKKMHAGHYLNLPVMEADGRIIAVVDVLKLTYATLEQMNSLSSNARQETDTGGPLWGRFFESIAAHDDTESVVSSSHVQSVDVYPSRQPQILEQSPRSELEPGDSASAIEDERLDEFPKQQRREPSSVAVAPSALPVDDGTYVFKFRTPSGRTHRFQARKDDIINLHDIVAGKLAVDPFFSDIGLDLGHTRDPKEFQLAYTDLDGDTVILSSNSDLEDAVGIARKAGSDRVVLHLQVSASWDVVSTGTNLPPTSQKQPEDTAEANTALPGEKSLNEGPLGREQIFGIPNELLLPASIGVLAAVIAGVFVMSRLTRD